MAIANIEAQRPGFIEGVKKQLRAIHGTPQKGLFGLGDWADDLFSSFGNDVGTPTTDAPVVEDDSNWWDSVADAAGSIIPAYFAYEKEKDWNELQLERAKSGQAPLPTAGYGAPPTTIQVTMPPGAAAQAVGIEPETVKMVLVGGGIIAALYMFAK